MVVLGLIMSSENAKGELSSGTGEGGTKIIGECGYCGKAILQKERILPLECLKCKGYFHVRCLRGSKPPVFWGDNLFRFNCGFCGPLGKENWERFNLQW